MISNNQQIPIGHKKEYVEQVLSYINQSTVSKYHKIKNIVANLKTKEELTKDHSFQLASVSKPFTSLATLQLIGNGQIKLEDTLQKFFPNLPYKGITVHQLLCHRSGLSQYPIFFLQWRQVINS